MSTLQIANRTLTAEEVIPMLASYQMIPQLLCEMIIDQAIASISCTPEEIAAACQQFEQQWQMTGETEKLDWLSQYSMSPVQLEKMATRRLRVEKFKQATWGRKLETYFLQRKSQLDQVIYSLIRTTNKDIANELYFRILEGEQSFAELAREYSQGPEALTGGIMGPVELGTLHPLMAQVLSTSPIGRVCPAIPLGDYLMIRRVEKIIPAQLNESMRQRLLQENFSAWFQEQLRQLSHQDQIWMGVSGN